MSRRQAGYAPNGAGGHVGEGVLTGLDDGLVHALVQRQVPHDPHDVPLDLQGVLAELEDPLQELKAAVGHDVVAVALDLQTGAGNMWSAEAR
jgi:hypothetical protein